MTERVLVTGASGFIGPHLVRALCERGDRVTCLVRRSSDLSALEHTGAVFVYGDVTEATSLTEPISQIDCVYHLAGQTRAFHPDQFYAVNEGGTRALARACARRESPPTLVMVSSIAAAGPSDEAIPRREDDPPTPVSHYGRSKLAAERAAAEYASEIPVTIVRPAWVFGEGDRDTLELFRWVARGVHLVPVQPRRRYSLLHAADLANLLIQAAALGERRPPPDEEPAPPGKGVYFAASQERPTYVELGRLVADALGRHRIWTVSMPPLLTRVVAVCVEAKARLLRQPPGIVNPDKAREGLVGSWVCSAEKACGQLGFSTAFTLAERLRQTAIWYREQGWL